MISPAVEFYPDSSGILLELLEFYPDSTGILLEFFYVHIRKMAKDVSRKDFLGAHLGVIVFHILLGALIIFAVYKSYHIGLYVAGGLLIVVSFGGLVPVLKDTAWNIKE